MNNVCKFLIVVLCISATSLKAQDYSNAATYMQYFSDQYRQVSKDMWDYMSAIARGKNARKVENRRKDLLKTLMEVKKKIEAVKPYNGDKALRDSTAAFLELNYRILNEDYSKIVELEEASEHSYDKMAEYLRVRRGANDKMNRASESLHLEQRRFAAQYQINIIDDESKLGRRLERAGKVFDYYDEIFLILFKSQSQESNMIDAQNKGDLKAFEEYRVSLLTNAEEGIRELSNFKSYMGDISLAQACKGILQFYKREAEDKAEVIIDFFHKKERFETLRAALEFKGEEVLREEIEEYNASVKDYNDAVVRFNAINNELNKERSVKVNTWNDAVKAFLDKQAS